MKGWEGIVCVCVCLTFGFSQHVCRTVCVVSGQVSEVQLSSANTAGSSP